MGLGIDSPTVARSRRDMEHHASAPNLAYAIKPTQNMGYAKPVTLANIKECSVVFQSCASP